MTRKGMSETRGTRARLVAYTSLATIGMVALAAISALAEPATVTRYQMYQADFSVAGRYANPYDAREVLVDATFSGPGGVLKVPCFWANDRWHARFASGAVGPWEWHAVVTDAKGTRPAADGAVSVIDSPASLAAAPGTAGYITVKPGSRYFSTSEGTAYVPIGSDVAWGTVDEYRKWFGSMSANGANFARVWSSSQGGFGLEGPEADGYPGLGRYREEGAESIDQVVRLSEKTGVRMLLALGSYRELVDSDNWGPAGWPGNPYNAANGGPLAKPDAMWTSPEAKALYKNRLRYVAARWGYSPAVMGWEFWNEVSAPAAWIREMSVYLKSVDAFGHLVSTSYGDKSVWELPTIDFTMTHIYREAQTEDMADTFRADAAQHLVYGKPHLLAEYGIDSRASDADYDPRGKAVSFRQGLWASFLAGAAGSGDIWWWDNYIAPENLYGTFAPFAKFVSGTDWRDATGALAISVSQRTVTLQDMNLNPDGGWGTFATGEFAVSPDGPDPNLTGLPGTIYGPGKAPWNKPVKLRLSCPKPTTMLLGIGSVSDNNRVEVSIDGVVAWSHDFQPKDGKGEWQSATYHPEWKIWQAVYNKEYAVEIPAGEHLVSIRDTKGDWVGLASVTLKSYSTRPPVLATGLVGARFAAFWLNNRADTWKAALGGRATAALTDISVTLGGMADGEYSVEWWNPVTGTKTSGSGLSVRGGAAALQVPAFTGEIACKLLLK